MNLDSEDDLALLERIRNIRLITDWSSSHPPEDRRHWDFECGRTAVETLLSRHVGWLSRLCAAEAGSIAAGEDCLQEVLLELARALPSFSGRSSLKTWMYAVSIRVARKTLSRERRIRLNLEESSKLALSPPANQDSPGKRLDLAEDRKGLLQHISKLSAQQKRAVICHYFEDLSIEETAKEMGCSIGSVKTHLSRARDYLGRKIERE